jgi:putative N6-adenine-specific DNA methylase
VRFFATTAAGTERALADELRELGILRLRPDRAGVSFSGKWEHAFRVCLESRIAVRVLHPVAEFECRDGQELYDGVRAVDWSEHLHESLTLAVTSVSRDSALSHTMFVSQRTKDAIVDQLRDRTGARPSVDRRDPDLAVFVRIVRDRATVALDLAGESLHRRGFRGPGERAPLKETLAAAILRLGGWDRRRPLIDPMCGSATIAIEADLWARNVAPGLLRARFGFERWISHDESRRSRMKLLRERLRAAIQPEGPPIHARDADPQAVDRARRTVRAANAHVHVERASIADLRGTDPPGHVVTNPPYGERLPTSDRLFRDIETAFSRLAAGHRVSILCAGKSPLRFPREAERHAVYNGALRCELVSFDL